MKIIFSVLLFLPSVVFADTYFIKKVTGKSSSEEAKSVARDLFESELADRNQEVVRDPRKAKFQIGIKVIKLGESFIIAINKRKDGKTLHADKMKAASIEEFDKVIGRLASAVLSESKARHNPKVGEITQKEQRRMVERRETKWYQAFGFGPSFLINHGTAPEKVGYHLRFDKIGEISPHFALRTSLETTMTFNNLFDSDENTKSSIDSFVAGTVGVNYFFSSGDIAPYATGHLGFGGSFGSSIDDDVGFVWGGGGGVEFFRTADTQLALTLIYSGLINTDLPKNPGQAALFLSFLSDH